MKHFLCCIGHRSEILPPVVLAFTLACLPLSVRAQWIGPKSLYEPAFANPYITESSRLGIAIGPARQLAVASLGNRLSLYASTDNGRGFHRVTIDTSLGGWFAWGLPSFVDGVGIDQHSRIFLFWREHYGDEQVAFYKYQISKSTDDGRSFSLFWSSSQRGGITTTSVSKGGWYIDSKDRLHCITDDQDFSSGFYTYVRISAADSSVFQETRIPDVEPDYGASPDVLVRGDTVHIAVSTGQYSGQSQLWYLRSTDNGASFQLKVVVDTVNAKNPRFLFRDGQLFLANVEGFTSRDYLQEDSIIVLRRLHDSIFVDPVILVNDLGHTFRGSPVSVVSLDSLLCVSFTRTQPELGVSFRRLSWDGATMMDSLFLPGRFMPAVALDSLDGIYLGSGSNDTICLMMRDVVLGVDRVAEGLPASFTVNQNYPNPFNQSTEIRYRLPVAADVRLVVYDVLGREVVVLLNERKPPGMHEVRFDASGLSSGVYFYRITARSNVQTHKMVLLK